jgi:DNA-binding response OmpR family regulator
MTGVTQPMNKNERPKILIVDDDFALLKMIETVLSQVGDVTRATDGLEALEILQRGFRPDLIVTDLMMPRVDGMKLSEQVKKNPQLSKTPIIILTAKGTPRDVVEGINVGARHYITKPFKTEDLLAKVRKTLGKKV